MGAFSTLLWQSGLRASTGDILATKSERKMLASTYLYSLYAWSLVAVSKCMQAVKLCSNSPAVLNNRCRLIYDALYNGRKTVVCVCVVINLVIFKFVKSNCKMPLTYLTSSVYAQKIQDAERNCKC